jgi:hypothetical protein
MDQELNKTQPRDWRELCKAAATELDPVKLMVLITEINQAFDELDQQRNPSFDSANDAANNANSFRMKFAGDI